MYLKRDRAGNDWSEVSGQMYLIDMNTSALLLEYYYLCSILTCFVLFSKASDPTYQESPIESLVTLCIGAEISWLSSATYQMN